MWLEQSCAFLGYYTTDVAILRSGEQNILPRATEVRVLSVQLPPGIDSHTTEYKAVGLSRMLFTTTLWALPLRCERQR
jgi:hypothetical protein